MKKNKQLYGRFFWNLAWTTALFLIAISGIFCTGFDIVEYFKTNGFKISVGPRPQDDLYGLILFAKFALYFFLYGLSIIKSWIGRYLINLSWKSLNN